MSLAAKLRRAPLRAVTGAFILNSGLEKFKADEDTAKQLHGLASGTYPFLAKVNPTVFVKGLAAGETVLGAAVAAPFVSPVVAGLGLMGFSGGLLNMYWNTPALHRDGDPRPTQAGVPIAKDVWMFGIGAGLVTDGLLSPAHDKKVKVAATIHEKRNRKERRKAKKAAKETRAELRGHAVEVAKLRQAELSKKATKAVKNAQKSDAAKKAKQASADAAKRIADAREEYAPVVAEKVKHAKGTAEDLYGQYAPVVAEKAKQARGTAADLYDGYAPVAAARTKQAASAAADLFDEYAPVVAEKAKQAKGTATDLYVEYAPIAADRARQARDAAAGWYDETSASAQKQAKQTRRSARRAAKKAKRSLR
ncbi:MAG: hypothetical protein ABI345_07440 [Jatrophihabitans sp.]